MVEYTDNPRKTLAIKAAHAAGYPAGTMTIIGITGTKGKSSCSWILFHLLRASGIKAALISTIKNYILDVELPAPLTTPQPDYLHHFLHIARSQGVTHVVMEVAAQALSLYRVHGISFKGIIFTNFAREHLEFYPDQEAYFNAKYTILDYASSDAFITTGTTGTYYEQIIAGAQKKQITLLAPIQPKKIINKYPLTCQIQLNNELWEYTIPSLQGNYNIDNISLTIPVALALGITPQQLSQAFATLPHIPGRCEIIPLKNGARAIIDYAHNPLSYNSILPMLKELSPHCIVVCGAGGDRDPGRRPIMGSIAATYADLLILTSDNPRSECPISIIDQMKSNLTQEQLQKTIIIVDREKAIHAACNAAEKNSLVILLGKGPDEYQIVGNTYHYFSEKLILQSWNTE